MQETKATRPVLVVDLDGTLIKSDMLYECFWAGFARDWRTPFRAASELRKGRAALKARLAACAPPDPASLPYTPEVLDYIRAWRETGGRVALVTAADQSLADAIARHLGLFDEVHGSDGQTNLKGPAKAALLTRRFASEGFVYIGDSPADLPVWQAAAGAVTVGLSPALRARVETLHADAVHLAPPHSIARAALRAMRPHQWLKNLLVFFPLLAAHVLEAGALTQAAIAFAAFSLVASSVYLLNDLLDLGADRAHPRKRNRPLASGALPLATGMVLVPILVLSGGALALTLEPLFLLVLLLYYALTITYSLWLKRRPIIDICTLASLYTLRVAAGGAATGLVLSVWLLAFSAFLFFSLAAVKRQAELVDMAERGLDTVAGRGYRVGDLPVITQMATASGFVAVLVLMLYVNEPTVLTKYNYPVLIWGACLVLLYWVARMILVAQRGRMEDDPVVFAARDRTSQVAFVLIVGLFVGAGLL
ncbi:MAG: UbiA family prenyltransferase [Rhodobacteraceae bacterium]|jgi:4-hydroxybenzoate polyprenyltransferase/phosphoserine phosphatase|nr:UbiA family prenyltransferase [Paracoccaceae bacterium]